jgi:hypothetical protein
MLLYLAVNNQTRLLFNGTGPVKGNFSFGYLARIKIVGTQYLLRTANFIASGPYTVLMMNR